MVYSYSRPWSKTEVVAVLQSCFLTGGVTRNLLMGIEGDYTRELLILVAWCAVPAGIGIWLGKLTLDRLPAPVLRRIVFLFVLAMGLKYLIWP